ncbi:glycosyltransferase [Staphylotrichum tortipilum]|uniref:Glycosyltransferase n=1 Tax=Staphylotrichum tortipilum TaxID=2831512 RepID=A0AAN6RQL0_9PEZI|nr:glycosyltransferase [Staphylotrichum longicolle]
MSAAVLTAHQPSGYPGLHWPGAPPVLSLKPVVPRPRPRPEAVPRPSPSPTEATPTQVAMPTNPAAVGPSAAQAGVDTRRSHPQSSGNVRLTRPSTSCTLGLVHITEEAQVLELDAHMHQQQQQQEEQQEPQQKLPASRDPGRADTLCFSSDTLLKVWSQMVIVVPCKDEELSVIRAVLSHIPSACLVILVSNCPRENGDARYKQQVAMVEDLGGDGRRQILAIHQKDRAAAAAFRAAGMPELICPSDGAIRSGKGEGMLLGTALAAAFCAERRYIGFVDADNLFAPSVHEYCKAFAAGFAMSPAPEHEDTMVRLRWSSKPKLLRNGQYDYVSEGRCSRIVNSWLNRLLVTVPNHQWNGGTWGSGNAAATNNTNTNTTASPDSFVTTGNAGEHAMTMNLALKLRMAAGYAIEPFHFIDLLERGHLLAAPVAPSEAAPKPMIKPPRRKSIGPISPPPTHTTAGNNNTLPPVPNTPPPLTKPIRIFQVRTITPHYHRPSGDDHIRRMWAASLGSIFHGLRRYDSDADDECLGCRLDYPHSPLREDMHAFAARNGGTEDKTKELPRPRVYRALEEVDTERFWEVLGPSLGVGSLRGVGFAGGRF